MTEGNKVAMLGPEEYTLFVGGMVGIVLSRCLEEIVAKFRLDYANSWEQEMDWSSQLALVLSGTVSFRITCRRRAEGVLTDRGKSTWSMGPSCCRS